MLATYQVLAGHAWLTYWTRNIPSITEHVLASAVPKTLRI